MASSASLPVRAFPQQVTRIDMSIGCIP